MVNKQDLKKFFYDSGLIYPEKLKHVDIDKAMDNIVVSYRLSGHMHMVEYDDNGIVAHIALLRLGWKTYLGHHHCSTSKGAGARVFIRFANWVAKNYGSEIEHLYGYYNRNPRFYDGIYHTVGNAALCRIPTVWYDPQEDLGEWYASSLRYGLNLNHWHRRTLTTHQVHERDKSYKEWYFKCTKGAIEASFDFFNKVMEEQQ